MEKPVLAQNDDLLIKPDNSSFVPLRFDLVK